MNDLFDDLRTAFEIGTKEDRENILKEINKRFKHLSQEDKNG